MDQQKIDEVTEKVKEYAELSKTIKLTQEKLKVLNKKKKELYKEVVPKLKTTNITKCNLPFGTLKVVKTKRKIMPSKVTMREKYISFFNTLFDQDFIEMSAEEKAAKQQAVKDEWANHRQAANWSAWTFDEATCMFVPPIPRPDLIEGKIVVWCGAENNWKETPAHPKDGKQYQFDFFAWVWVEVTGNQ
jgi:hypothetical protein